MQYSVCIVKLEPEWAGRLEVLQNLIRVSYMQTLIFSADLVQMVPGMGFSSSFLQMAPELIYAQHGHLHGAFAPLCYRNMDAASVLKTELLSLEGASTEQKFLFMLMERVEACEERIGKNRKCSGSLALLHSQHATIKTWFVFQNDVVASGTPT